MAFPSTPILDALDRTENPLSNGGKWTTNWQFGTSVLRSVAGNGAYSASSYGSASWSTAAFGPALHEVYVLSPSSGDCYLVACIPAGMTSDSFISGYSLNWNPSVSGTIVLGRYVSNSVTTLDTTNIGTFSSVDQVGLRIGNGEVRAFYNGTEIMVASDSTYASGYFGILTSQTGATGFRNFGGGLTPVPSLPVAGQTSWADALNQWLMADHTSVGVNNPPYVVQRNVLLSAHGFTAGQAISLGAGGYVKAKADAASTSQVVGMVGASPLTNQFNLITQGYVRNLSGFTAGTLYYLSAATAGALTSTAPSTSGQIVKPLFIADSTTSGYFINQRGIAVP